MARAIWHNTLCEKVTGEKDSATMLVDGVDNKVDLAYGRNPNGITIIDKNGRIV